MEPQPNVPREAPGGRPPPLAERPESAAGLSTEEAERRLREVGPNAVTERRTSPLRELLGYFWGPIPWMIEAAAALSLLAGHLADFVIIAVLLVLNAVIGFAQEHEAGDAIAELRQKLALEARVLRDGRWRRDRSRARSCPATSCASGSGTSSRPTWSSRRATI